MTRPGVEPSKRLSAADVAVPRASTKRMMVRAFAKRCPRCGTGHLFRHWTAMAKTCPGCGYRFDRGDDAFFLGAYTVNLVVSETVIFGFFMFMILGQGTDSDPPVAALLAAMLATSVLLPIFFYPFSKTVWAALHLANDPLELSEIVDAIDALTPSPSPDAGPAEVAGESGADPQAS